MLLTELPLLERARYAAGSGFSHVEFWWPFERAVPGDRELDRFLSSIEQAGVTLVGINFASGSREAGEHGLLSWQERSSEFRDNVDVVVGIGERMGCRLFNALYGNRMDDRTPEAQDEVALGNLAVAAAAVDRIGGTVLLEPLSGAERYPLARVPEALDVIDRMRRLGHRNIKLLADLYHVSNTGGSVEGLIDDHLGDIGHVQIADSPGRGVPGSGALPLRSWLDRLSSRGYDGYVGLEYRAPLREAFRWLDDGQSDRTASP